MIIKLSYTAFLALVSTTATTNAFLSRGTHAKRSSTAQMVGGWDNEDFLAALSGTNSKAGDKKPEEEELEADQGGSMFKEILQKAKERVEPGPPPIMNPFLAAPNNPIPPIDPSEISVEEQARMYREMMKNNAAVPPAPMDIPPPGRRVARTDRAGKPVGRNRDADTIANTADLYFAQLKRDSSVRGFARLQGDEDYSNKVFADEGIKELETILVQNPYLTGLREKEQSLFDTVPEEVIKPFFDPDKLPEEERTTSGISYKDIIKKRRQNQDSETQSSAAPTTSPPKADAVPLTATINELPSVVPQKAVSPQPVVQMAPPPPPVQTQTFQQAPTLIKSPETVLSLTEPSDPEGTKKKIRTFMGMLLKHRGGPGFGKGRLKGREIEQFDNLLEEVTGFLRVEAAQSSTTVYDAPPATREPSVPQPVMIQPAMTVDPPTSVATPAQLDSMLACIEGAVLMYKNSPAELKSTVMVTLRAALAAAITTCDNAIGSDTNPIPTAASQVDGTIAVIEGAVSMYRNSPPELQSSVLITLRAALKIAVITCDSLLGTAPTVPSALSVPVVPAASVAVAQPVAATVPSQPVSPLSVPVVPATDRNSKALNEIYDKVKAASGEGRLGLRSDLSSEEASQLADGLMEMRGILMEELDAGIPDPEPAQGAQDSSGENSTISKYQQMLAKAKTEKTGNP